MAEIKKESGLERFLKEGFSFADLRKEVDAGSIKVKQEVNHVSTIEGDKVDMSLIRIKTEPGLIADCDVAPAPINFMHHQQVSSSETITAIKEEIDSDTDVDNNNVTVHLFIPETILAEKVEDVQANSEENLSSSVDSDMQSMLTKTTEDCLQLNVRLNQIPENAFRQSISESTNKQPGKGKYGTNILAPQSSTSGLSQINSGIISDVEPSDFATSQSSAAGLSQINSGIISDSEPPDSVRKRKASQDSVPQTSTTGCDKTNISQQPKKRGRKKQAQGTVKKTNKERVICPFCDRPVVKSYFSYHARVHTDEKPFKCPKCPYRSHFKGPLDFHMESHHPTEGYIKPK